MLALLTAYPAKGAPARHQLVVLIRVTASMAGRDWVRAIREKLRDDLGDCPTLSEELLELLSKFNTAQDDGSMLRVSSAKRQRDKSATVQAP